MRIVLAMAARVVAVVVTALLIERFCVIPFRCMHMIKVVEQRTETAMNRLDHLAAQGVARENLQLLDEVASGCRTDADLHLLLAFNDKLLGRQEEALQHLNDAISIDDRPEFYFDRGLMLIDLGRIDEAARELAIAVRFNPDLVDRLDGEMKDIVLREVQKAPHF